MQTIRLYYDSYFRDYQLATGNGGVICLLAVLEYFGIDRHEIEKAPKIIDLHFHPTYVEDCVMLRYRPDIGTCMSHRNRHEIVGLYHLLSRMIENTPDQTVYLTATIP